MIIYQQKLNIVIKFIIGPCWREIDDLHFDFLKIILNHENRIKKSLKISKG
jgi:hypothetical protein